MDFDTYLSPYSWRYGSPEMRQIWSETHKRRTWRLLWVLLAEVQAELGLVGPEEVADLRAQMARIDMKRALQIEAEIHHDLMAELRTFAEQCPRGGRVLHLGMTSMDIVDNADVLRIREALGLILQELGVVLQRFTEQIDRWADLVVMGFTHLQPAEPTTLGYRLAFYAQDFLQDWANLVRLGRSLKGKGFRGAVGSAASFAELLGASKLDQFDAMVSQKLGLSFFEITNQTYPRKQDYELLSALAGLAATAYKFAFDLRILQMPPIGELSEAMDRHQVGSSAMPFKRNPIRAEKIDSLARLLAQFPRVAWDNAAHSLLERTLDDSANRRSTLPEAFLLADELLAAVAKICGGLQPDLQAVAQNLAVYGPFAATEPLLMALVKRGADRQAMHERIRQHSLAAWEAIRQGGQNPLESSLERDADLLAHLPAERISELLQTRHYTGNAAERARRMARDIRTALASLVEQNEDWLRMPAQQGGHAGTANS